MPDYFILYLAQIGSAKPELTKVPACASSSFFFLFSAILITGGGPDGTSAEVFLPSTATSCELPELVVRRSDHTLDGFLACGGYNSDALTSCEEFSPTTGTWALTTHTLKRR